MRYYIEKCSQNPAPEFALSAYRSMGVGDQV